MRSADTCSLLATQQTPHPCTNVFQGHAPGSASDGDDHVVDAPSLTEEEGGTDDVGEHGKLPRPTPNSDLTAQCHKEQGHKARFLAGVACTCVGGNAMLEVMMSL